MSRNDCICGFPSGENVDNCERCVIIAERDELGRMVALYKAERDSLQERVARLEGVLDEIGEYVDVTIASGWWKCGTDAVEYVEGVGKTIAKCCSVALRGEDKA